MYFVCLVCFVLLSLDSSLAQEDDGFVNYFEVLGVPETATTKEIKKAYRLLVMKMHPDKVPIEQQEEAGKKFVNVQLAYGTLKDEKDRLNYLEELTYYRQHGRLRWQLRYRVYPRTNVWLVILCFVVVTNYLQYYLKNRYHRRMQMIAKMTISYKTEYNKRLKQGLDPEDIVIEIKGAEPFPWHHMWAVQLVMLPYTLYKCVLGKKNDGEKEEVDAEDIPFEDEEFDVEEDEVKQYNVKAVKRNKKRK